MHDSESAKKTPAPLRTSFRRAGALLALALPLSLASIGLSFGQGSNTSTPPAAGGGDAAAQPDKSLPPSESAEALLRKVATPEMDVAIREAVAFLAASQSQKDGSFSDDSTTVGIATTALAGMALIANGSTASSGPYAGNIVKAVEYLLSTQDPTTGAYWGDGSRIHGVGYALLFMSQVYGTCADPNLEDRLQRSMEAAVRCLVAGQTDEGGWGYVPDDRTWDEGSTTVVCLQGLRGAQAAGIKVKSSVIANAIGYMQKIARPQDFRDRNGRVVRGYHFLYSLTHNAELKSWAQVGSCISCLNQVGVYSQHARWSAIEIGEILRGGMAWLVHHSDDFFKRHKAKDGKLDTNFFYYAVLYAAQCTWQYADTAPFREIYPKIRDRLLEMRRISGSRGWSGNSYFGTTYETSMALLILQMPYQYLPMFQR